MLSSPPLTLAITLKGQPIVLELFQVSADPDAKGTPVTSVTYFNYEQSLVMTLSTTTPFKDRFKDAKH